MAASGDVSTIWTPGRPVDLRATLGSLRRGHGDPTWQWDAAAGALWWATMSPVGPGTLRLSMRYDERSRGHRDCLVDARAWGAGAQWLIDGVPTLLGSGDTSAAGFSPVHAQVRDAWRATPGWRVPKTRRPFEACVAAIVEQKVTGVEARSSWRRLLRRFGVRAPGPTPMSMHVPPVPSTFRELSDADFHWAGVTPQRARTLRTAAAAASAIDRTSELPVAEADRVLRALPGIGVWTSAEVRQRAHGDADAVSFGDFHVAKDICWWLTGQRGDDVRLATLLEDYAGHRYRVQRLMELTGATAPRRGPRLTIPVHRRSVPR